MINLYYYSSPISIVILSLVWHIGSWDLVSAFIPLINCGNEISSSSRCSSLEMAVSRKEKYRITVLPGDGIGPEITSATAEVLSSLCKRCGFEMDLKEALIGGAAIDAKNDPFPEETLQQCLASDSVLLACIGGYKVR